MIHGGAQSIHKPHDIEFPYSISYLKDQESKGEEFTRETHNTTHSLTHSNLVLENYSIRSKVLSYIIL